MTRVLLIALVLSLGYVHGSCVYAASLYEEWRGSYSYSQLNGSTEDGDDIIYDIALTITGSGCAVYEDGFRIMSRIGCYLAKNNGGIDVKFKNYLPDNALAKPYKSGDTLFSLKKSKKPGQLLTTWSALNPDADSVSGIYLLKLK